MPAVNMKCSSIVPQSVWPGREDLSSLWVIVPVVGLVPVLMPYTFLQVGHCKKGVGELDMRAVKHAEWKEWEHELRLSTGARVESEE